MYLDYKVLWIDDNIEGVKSQQETLEGYIKEKGFEFKPFHALNENTLAEIIADDINFDFIFIDNNFNDIPRGAEFIKSLRAKKVFSDILFYSGVATVANLNDIVKANNLQSVYVYSKLDITNDISLVTDIMDYRINREMDDSSTRGIAMSEIAKLDGIIWKIIEKNVVQKEIAEKIKEQKREHCKMCWDTDENLCSLAASNKGTMVLNSLSRVNVLNSKVLKGKHIYVDKYTEIKDNYQKELLDVRNVLAHQIDISLEDEEKITFRSNLIKFRKIFNELADDLCKKS